MKILRSVIAVMARVGGSVPTPLFDGGLRPLVVTIASL
jgi:hypothetical protein